MGKEVGGLSERIKQTHTHTYTHVHVCIKHTDTDDSVVIARGKGKWAKVGKCRQKETLLWVISAQ